MVLVDWLTPDILLADLQERYLVDERGVQPHGMLGKGAYGRVLLAQVTSRAPSAKRPGAQCALKALAEAPAPATRSGDAASLDAVGSLSCGGAHLDNMASHAAATHASERALAAADVCFATNVSRSYFDEARAWR